ncbi:MAG: Arginine N-methyltransferase 2 [Candelina mexicana]|nr:MAG: Arginine N-methyltransferase 2 [Candelina mexicana]
MAEEEEIEYDTLAQSVLLASSQHDIPALRKLLHNCRANFQDPESLSSPLHAAIAACDPDLSDSKNNDEHVNGTTNGATNGTSNGDLPDTKTELEQAAATLKYLLQNGAIWNDLDANNETPGCIAKRLGLDPLYDIMVDAGVRAELLLNRLDGYEALPEADSDSEEDDVNIDIGAAPAMTTDENPSNVKDDPSSTTEDTSSTPNIPASNPSPPPDPSLTNSTYLSSTLTPTPTNTLLDASSNGVMMTWETPIMTRTATLLLPTPNLRVLNIGHGLGILDNALQTHSPASHHIIEAHPTVLSQMRSNNWSAKPNIVIHEGRWQDIAPNLLEQGETFDAIYFDTFAEPYSALRTFFSEFVVGLLSEGGRFGFFMGCGADRRICYDVYTKVVKMDLFEAGFEVEWEEIEVDVGGMEERGEWEGVRRRYWVLDEYRLPICRFLE